MQDVPPSANLPPAYPAQPSSRSDVCVPTNSQPAPGDVLDLTVGTFSVSLSLGAANFTSANPGTSAHPDRQAGHEAALLEYQLLLRSASPRARLRRGVSLLLTTYDAAQQWVGMLVTIENVTFPDNLADDGKGRDTIHIMTDTSGNGPTLSNELFDVASWNSSFGADAGGPPPGAGEDRQVGHRDRDVVFQLPYRPTKPGRHRRAVTVASPSGARLGPRTGRLRDGWPLLVLMIVTACGAPQSRPVTAPAAQTARSDLRRIEGRPPVAVLAREGDPRQARSPSPW